MKTINVGEVAVFDHVEPNKEQALKILEEAAEVFGAWQEWDRKEMFYGDTRNSVINEIADVIQACANLVSSLELRDLTSAMGHCEQRNIERGRITPEPLDTDGVPIKIGDKLYFVGGDDTPLKCVGFHSDGDVIFTDWEETGTFAYENATVFTHKKPDSWEQWEADGKKSGAEYWSCEDEHLCIECEHGFVQTSKTCTVNKYIDLIRRAKALAGVDDESL